MLYKGLQTNSPLSLRPLAGILETPFPNPPMQPNLYHMLYLWEEFSLSAIFSLFSLFCHLFVPLNSIGTCGTMDDTQLPDQ